MKRLAFIFALLMASASAFGVGVTYYVATGSTACGGSACSDSNNGTSKTTAWLHAPGMTGATGLPASYSCNSGDVFTLRGGDTWAAANLPWFINCASVTVTTDHTWYAGASYVRPIISGGGTFPGAANSNMINLQSFTNITVNDLEITGMYVNQSTNNVAVFRSGGTGSVMSNIYIHGWTVNSSATNDEIAAFWTGAGTTVFGSVVDGSDATIPACKSVSPCAAMQVFYASGPCVAYQNYAKDVANFFNATCATTVNFHDNSGPAVYADWDNATHGNYYQNNAASGACYIYNNYAGPMGIGWTFPFNLHMGSSNSCYIFNNVYNNIGSVIGISFSTLDNTITTSTVNVFNNTFEPGADSGSGPSNPCMILETDATAIGYPITNNHCITTGALNSYYPSGSCTGSNCTLTSTTNRVQSKTTENGNGYNATQTYPWSPTSGSSPTVGAGTNQSALCSGMADATAKAACANDTTLGVTEITGEGGYVISYPSRATNSRPTSGAWDQGAYEFLLSCAAPTYGCALNSTQSGGKAVIQNISPTPNVGNLTGAGTVVSPADFGLPICRVTDSTFDPTIPNATIVANSGGSGDETLFNTNSTLYILGAGGQGYPMSLNFNGVTCTTARLYASNASWTAHGGWYLPTDDPGWSYTNPYLLFIFDGTNPAIDSYNVTGYTPTGTPPSNVVQFDFRHGQTGSWGTTSANGLPSNYVMTWSSFGKQNKATGSLAADQIFGAGVSNAIVIAGVVASGTFTNGETVTQAGTGSTATLHFVHTNLYVDTVTGSPNNSGTWTGGTSGATFTPSASPTAAGQNYGTDAVAYKVGSGVSYLNTLTGVVTGDFGTVGTVGIGDRFTIHNTKLSKDGAWLLISFEFCLSTCTNNVNTPYFWQIGTTNLYPGCVPSNDCGGHYTEGYSHFINDDGSPTLQQISRVYGNNSTASVIPMGLPWSGSTCTGTNVVDIHQNWTNADTADSYPFFQTTIFATPATASNPYICAGADEVQGINSSTGTVYRFAHTYNTDQNTNFSTASAIGAVSQDGNFALFSSDWKGTLGSTSGGSTCTITSTCRGDVFVVALTGVLSQATPSTCTPGSGTYSSTQTPACTNPNSGTTVQCYTTNGTTPATNGDGATCAIGTSLASGSTVSISTNTTLEIIAGTSTLADSAVTTYTYFIKAIAPTASPTSGSVPQTVTVTDTNTGTHIVCYNTTGSPATNGLGSACAPGSTHYTGPLSVTLPETLYIVAGTSTLVDSTVNSYTYGAVSNVAPAVVMF